MKRISLLILSVLTIIGSLQAQVVEMSKAKTIAENAYYLYCANRENLSESVDFKNTQILYDKNNLPLIYVFYNISGGFVILSADYAAMPLIGYSATNGIDFANLPAGFADLLNNSAMQIEHIRANKLMADNKIAMTWKTLTSKNLNLSKQQNKSVAPLLNMKWGQGSPFNDLCPADASGPGGNAATGCAATAFAQVMAYYNFPQHGIGSNSYNHPNYGTISANFENATYHWNLMFDSITDNAPAEIKQAAALISFHVGVAMYMQYGPNGSGVTANQVLQPVINHFGYNPASNYAWKDDYSATDWVALLQQQLDSGLPLVYRGYSNVGGHLFICDGYQDDEYFHFNWGWTGIADGYFYIHNLNPLNYAFNLYNYCITDFYPDYNYSNSSHTEDTLIHCASIIDDGSGPIRNYCDSLYSSWLIAPQSTENIEQIKIHFNYFNTEAGHDMLKIYNGSPSKGNLLAEYSGDSLIQDLIIMNDTVFIEFCSDTNGITAKGWELLYQTITNTNHVSNYAKKIKQINVFPNPTNEFIWIHNSIDNINIEEVRILNSSGQEKLCVIYPDDKSSPKVRINTSQLSSGIYFVIIKTKNMMYCEKIIVQ